MTTTQSKTFNQAHDVTFPSTSEVGSKDIMSRAESTAIIQDNNLTYPITARVGSENILSSHKESKWKSLK